MPRAPPTQNGLPRSPATLRRIGRGAGDSEISDQRKRQRDIRYEGGNVRYEDRDRKPQMSIEKIRIDREHR